MSIGPWDRRGKVTNPGLEQVMQQPEGAPASSIDIECLGQGDGATEFRGSLLRGGTLDPADQQGPVVV